MQDELLDLIGERVDKTVNVKQLQTKNMETIIHFI